MRNMTLENIAKACQGTLKGDTSRPELEIASVVTDSRKVSPGCLFVPIVGARADGHDFIPQVMAHGAACTLSEREIPGASFPYIQVLSSLQAMKDMAMFYLEQLSIPVVGITGSVGKTSTKEMIAQVLSQKYKVLKTEGNFNNELGLPITVLRLSEEDEIAVLEMGISDFGEMSRLARIARPDVAVITGIGTCHLENLHDRDGVLSAKTEIFDFVRKDGKVVLNGDDDKLQTVTREKTHGIEPVFYGLDAERDGVYADEICKKGFAGTSALLHFEGQSVQVLVPVPGIHMVYNALAAAAVGSICGLSRSQIKTGIESVKTIPGRQNLIKSGRLTIVDDCYNANPMSMKASLDVLRDCEGRRVALLGDMGELGPGEERLHEEVGAHAAKAGIDVCVFTGVLSEAMMRGARKHLGPGQRIFYEPDRQSLLAHLSEYVKAGDTVLVKASHFMAFEQVVEALKRL